MLFIRKYKSGIPWTTQNNQTIIIERDVSQQKTTIIWTETMQQLKLKTKTTHQNNWFSKSEISLERMRVRGACVCVCVPQSSSWAIFSIILDYLPNPMNSNILSQARGYTWCGPNCGQNFDQLVQSGREELQWCVSLCTNGVCCCSVWLFVVQLLCCCCCVCFQYQFQSSDSFLCIH